MKPALQKNYFSSLCIQFVAGLCLEAHEGVHLCMDGVEVGDDAALFGKGRNSMDHDF